MKLLILVALVFATVFSFQMADVSEVNWPFKSCGDGNFAVSKFTWEQTPTRGKKMKFTVVIIFVFSLVLPKPTLPSIKLVSLYPSMVSPSMSLLTISRNHTLRDPPSLTLMIINYQRLQETMEIWLLSTMQKTIHWLVYQSHTNSDLWYQSIHNLII